MTGQTRHDHGQCVPECTEDQSESLERATLIDNDASEAAFDEMVKLGQQVDPVKEEA